MRIALNTFRMIYQQVYRMKMNTTYVTHYQQFLSPPVANSFWRRYCSGNMAKVNYDEVKTATHDKKTLIIDVREPQELLDTGVIPGSVNVPLGRIEDVLRNMSPNDFLQKYGRPKPTSESPIIFSCKSGRRSSEAQQIARGLGFSNTKNYFGGWLDWETREEQKCQTTK